MKSLRFLERVKSKKAMEVTKMRRKSCYTPFPGPTRVADPNRVLGETIYWDSLPDFFF